MASDGLRAGRAQGQWQGMYSMRLLVARLRASLSLRGLFGAAPVEAREVVAFRDGNVSAGTIVVRTGERRLYYVLGDGRAIRYPVGVGRASKQWTGTTRIDGKYVRPPGRRRGKSSATSLRCRT